MKTLWILVLTFSLAFPTLSFAQHILGQVVDASTGVPLSGATVQLVTTHEDWATDTQGRFQIGPLKPGAHTLTVSHIGYRTWTSEIVIGERDTDLRIPLTAEILRAAGLEVFAGRAVSRSAPVSFSGISRTRLEDGYSIQDVPVLLSDLPSSTFTSESGNGMGYTYLRIRGFDQRRLAVMINGIPQNDPEDHNVYWLDFADLLGSVDEIQVQRGAGSAFYGPPAIGGSINIITGDFADRKGLTISHGLGSHATRKSSIAFGSGLVDQKYTMYARLSTMSTGGYREHSGMRVWQYYASATRYDSDFTTRITLYGAPVEDELAYYGLPKFAMSDREERKKNYNYWSADSSGYTWTQPRRRQEHEQFFQPHYELLNEWRITDQLLLNSALFHVRGTGYFDYDGTGWTNAEYYRLTEVHGFPGATDPINPIIRAYVDNEQTGWLPRLTWKLPEIVLTTGLELRRHRSLHWGTIQSAAGLPASLEPGRRYYEYRGGKDVASAYAQMGWMALPRTTVQASLQYVFNRYRVFEEKFVGTDFSVDYHFLNPRLGINYNIDEQWNIYVSANRTQREPRLKNLYDAAESSGGATPQFALKADSTLDFSTPLVQPENLVNLELGAGFAWDLLNLRMNIYVMDFRNEIIKSGQLDRFGQPITGNAPRSMHYGLEVEGSYGPWHGFSLDLNGLISRSRLEEYRVFTSTTEGVVARSLDGNRIAGVPEILANAGLRWQSESFGVNLTVKHVGDQYTDNEENSEYRVEASTVMNAGASWKFPAFLSFSGALFRITVSNVFDTLYVMSGEGEQFFPAAERAVFADLTVQL